MRSSFVWLISVLCCFILSSCEKLLNIKTPANHPKAVFDDLWTAIDKRYSLFSIKNVDWDSMYQQNISSIDDRLSEAELFKKCSDLLEVLKDGHVSLISANQVYTYENFYKSFPANFNEKNILNIYLKGQYTKLGPIIYKIVNGVAYLRYASFREDIKDEQLDKFFSEISDTKGLIIDVRSNLGGSLSNVEKLYSRLIESRKLVKYELYKKGSARDDFYNEEAHYISPLAKAYDRPIVVLTNRSCFSACNDFVLYMSQLENVILVGDQTGGGGAIPANYILSNGWRLQYSSSITLSPDRVSVENGILPDINIIISPVQETRGIDSILEKAYEILR